MHSSGQACQPRSPGCGANQQLPPTTQQPPKLPRTCVHGQLPLEQPSWPRPAAPAGAQQRLQQLPRRRRRRQRQQVRQRQGRAARLPVLLCQVVDAGAAASHRRLNQVRLSNTLEQRLQVQQQADAGVQRRRRRHRSRHGRATAAIAAGAWCCRRCGRPLQAQRALVRAAWQLLAANEAQAQQACVRVRTHANAGVHKLLRRAASMQPRCDEALHAQPRVRRGRQQRRTRLHQRRQRPSGSRRLHGAAGSAHATSRTAAG